MLSPPPAPWISPTETSPITKVQDRGDRNERPSLEEDQKATIEPDSTMVQAFPAPLSPPLDTVVTADDDSEVNSAKCEFP